MKNSMWHDFKRSIGRETHYCNFGKHHAPIDDFDEATIGVCNPCKPIMAAESERAAAEHRNWLVWRDSPEGRLFYVCNDAVNASRALEYFQPGEDASYAEANLETLLQRVSELASIPFDDAWQFCLDMPASPYEY